MGGVEQSNDFRHSSLKCGEIFDDRYLVKEELGRGGYAIVYRATQLDLERDVAIKSLSKDKLLNAVAVERFMREFRILSDFRHKNIMLVYHVSRSQDGVPYAACEYIQGRSLRSVVEKEPVSWRRALSIVSEIAEACAYAHNRDVVHRDLKPENVMLVQDGASEHIKLLDFGLSINENRGDNQKLTATGQVIGTLSYLSPESFHGRVDARADIYSLACILFELLAGQSLFSIEGFSGSIVTNLRDEPAQRFESIKEPLPEQLFLLLNEMLAKNPDERLENMDRVLQDIKSIQNNPGKLLSARKWRSSVTKQMNALPGFIGMVLIASLLFAVIVSAVFPNQFAETIALTQGGKTLPIRTEDARVRFGEIQRTYRREVYVVANRVQVVDSRKIAAFMAELEHLIAVSDPKDYALQYSLWQFKGWLEYSKQNFEPAEKSFAKAAEYALSVSPDSVEAAQSLVLIGLSLIERQKSDLKGGLEFMKKGVAIFEKYDDADSYISIEGGTKVSWADNYKKRVPFNRTLLTIFFGADGNDPYLQYARFLEINGDCDNAIKYYLKASKNQRRIGDWDGIDSELNAIKRMTKCGHNDDARSHLQALEKYLVQKSKTNFTDTIGMLGALRATCRDTGNSDLEKRVSRVIEATIQVAPDPNELRMLLRESDHQHGYK